MAFHRSVVRWLRNAGIDRNCSTAVHTATTVSRSQCSERNVAGLVTCTRSTCTSCGACGAGRAGQLASSVRRPFFRVGSQSATIAQASKGSKGPETASIAPAVTSWRIRSRAARAGPSCFSGTRDSLRADLLLRKGSAQRQLLKPAFCFQTARPGISAGQAKLTCFGVGIHRSDFVLLLSALVLRQRNLCNVRVNVQKCFFKTRDSEDAH